MHAYLLGLVMYISVVDFMRFSFRINAFESVLPWQFILPIYNGSSERILRILQQCELFKAYELSCNGSWYLSLRLFSYFFKISRRSCLFFRSLIRSKFINLIELLLWRWLCPDGCLFCLSILWLTNYLMPFEYAYLYWLTFLTLDSHLFY